MRDQSFRDILSQFLEEKSQNSSHKEDSQATFTPETPSFYWQNPKPAARGHYPTPPPPPPKIKPVPPVELSWSVEQLTATDQQRIKTLIQLGANELSAKVSLSLVKKAHRRLVRRLHPDARGNNEGQEQFLLLQSIYEGLSRSLKQLSEKASESACGNESASAAESQRQDAA